MKTLAIKKRIVNAKNHTMGFVLTGDRKVTRAQAVSLARQSAISGVRVVKSSQGTYLQSTTPRNLYELPTVSQK